MRNFSHKKGWKLGTNPSHLESPSIPLIKGTCNGKSEKDCVKLNLCRYYTSSTSDLYEFKMFLFENGEPEDFLLFVHNFNITHASSGTLEVGVKVQYLRPLVCGYALRQVDLLSADVESTNLLTLENIIKGLV